MTEVFDPSDKSKVELAYFSTGMVAMRTEINRHPVLVAQLVELGASADWADQVAEIAAYCNVSMDGFYGADDLEILYPQLTKRMVDTRLGGSAGIILHSH